MMIPNLSSLSRAWHSASLSNFAWIVRYKLRSSIIPPPLTPAVLLNRPSEFAHAALLERRSVACLVVSVVAGAPYYISYCDLHRASTSPILSSDQREREPIPREDANTHSSSQSVMLPPSYEPQLLSSAQSMLPQSLATMQPAVSI